MGVLDAHTSMTSGQVARRMRHRAALLLFISFLFISASTAPGDPPYGSAADLGPLSQHLKPNSAVLIGEVHGTEESPKFLLDVASSALQSGQKVTVALEIPSVALEFPSVAHESFYASNLFWASSYKDGRNSVAMRELIEKLRSWKQGDALSLLAIDAGPDKHGAERDAVMASNLAQAINQNKDRVYLVLTGNVHNRLEPGTPWDSNFAPMGLQFANLVKEYDTSIISLDPYYYEGGSAYICESDTASGCREVVLSKRAKIAESDHAPRGVRITRKGSFNRVFGYYYFTKAVSPSRPAVESSQAGTMIQGASFARAQ